MLLKGQLEDVSIDNAKKKAVNSTFLDAALAVSVMY